MALADLDELNTANFGSTPSAAPAESTPVENTASPNSFRAPAGKGLKAILKGHHIRGRWESPYSYDALGTQ